METKPITIAATFKGQDGSMGYKTGKKYNLFVTGNNIVPCVNQPGTLPVEYGSLRAFFDNWEIEKTQRSKTKKRSKIFIYSNGTVSIENGEDSFGFSFVALIAAELEKLEIDLETADIETVVNGETKYLKIEKNKDAAQGYSFQFTDF